MQQQLSVASAQVRENIRLDFEILFTFLDAVLADFSTAKASGCTKIDVTKNSRNFFPSLLLCVEMMQEFLEHTNMFPEELTEAVKEFSTEINKWKNPNTHSLEDAINKIISFETSLEKWSMPKLYEDTTTTSTSTAGGSSSESSMIDLESLMPKLHEHLAILLIFMVMTRNDFAKTLAGGKKNLNFKTDPPPYLSLLLRCVDRILEFLDYTELKDILPKKLTEEVLAIKAEISKWQAASTYPLETAANHLRSAGDKLTACKILCHEHLAPYLYDTAKTAKIAPASSSGITTPSTLFSQPQTTTGTPTTPANEAATQESPRPSS
ncbi:MAG: hypothetical protein WCW01_05470 [Gammaproteobacteria bacterium]